MLPSAPEQRGAGIPEAEKPDAGKQKASLLSLEKIEDVSEINHTT